MSHILLLLITAPLIVALIHSVLNRIGRIHPHKTPFVAGFISAIIWTPLWLWACRNAFSGGIVELACDIVFGSAYMFCVVFLNWFVFTITDVSMHIQLLMQIHRAPGVDRSQLLSRYNKGVILGNRIPRLIELGQLRMVGDKLLVSGKSVLAGARFCELLRWILGLPLHPSEARHE